MRGDGSCLFHSVSSALQSPGTSGVMRASGIQLRRLVANYVRDRLADTEIGIWFDMWRSMPVFGESYDVVHGLEDLYDTGGVDAVVDTIAERILLPEYWGNEFVLSVLARCLQINIIVVHRMAYPRDVVYDHKLFLQLEDDHYEPLFYNRVAIHDCHGNLPPIPGERFSHPA